MTDKTKNPSPTQMQTQPIPQMTSQSTDQTTAQLANQGTAQPANQETAQPANQEKTLSTEDRATIFRRGRNTIDWLKNPRGFDFKYPAPDSCAKCDEDYPGPLTYHWANIYGRWSHKPHSYLLGSLCKKCAEALNNEETRQAKEQLYQIFEFSVGSKLICDLIYHNCDIHGILPQDVAYIIADFLSLSDDMMAYARVMKGGQWE